VQRATGIGGIFIRASDPVALAEWYRLNLGIEVMDPSGSGSPWAAEGGLTVVSTFAQDSDYFGSREQSWMLNFRVADLDAMLAQLRAGGATVDAETQAMPGIGRFGWAADPEGNRFELWQPEPPGS